VKDKTGEELDGANLMNKAFSLENPRNAILETKRRLLAR